jgi:hypothetical protein
MTQSVDVDPHACIMVDPVEEATLGEFVTEVAVCSDCPIIASEEEAALGEFATEAVCPGCLVVVSLGIASCSAFVLLESEAI